MSKYRTAQGKILDMNALIAKNEKVRAVGNMKVNARGDSIDGQGRIIKPVTQKVTDGYAKTVGNRSARAKKVAEDKKVKDPEVTKDELMELEGFDDGADEVEKIKAQETKKR